MHRARTRLIKFKCLPSTEVDFTPGYLSVLQVCTHRAEKNRAVAQDKLSDHQANTTVFVFYAQSSNVKDVLSNKDCFKDVNR